jgi:hypothetical protein
MTKRFTLENVIDFIIPLFMVELLVFANIVLILVLLQSFGVI